ncbi:hypothetical protein [Escherichia phage vB_EcoM_LMP25]|uniref:Uncharacterized protein n=1 Tax=Escherichia phage vB_EcoM_LMP25 TaxID=2491663 RepID=A0A482MS29_9CAUD|nr:hypothetical protein [Escherichia phage vB_EcoM_LMP34]QBQ76161.1 hypothetical protein [Escherichia phage vB_EcoM_LMP33]QBQ76359.1 hypothetical protein [Escherichia phage vB_EcoM_LMP25]
MRVLYKQLNNQLKCGAKCYETAKYQNHWYSSFLEP